MRKLYFLSVAILVLALFACSKQTTAPDPPAATSTGEVPAQVQAQLDLYVVQDEDALASFAPGHPNPLNPSDDEYDVYAVTYLWGAFFPLGGGPLVWDGRTAIHAEAAMRVAASIDFEEGEQILFDSAQPSTFGWISSTQNDLDGASFLLFVKRGVVYVAPPVLMFGTQPISFEIPVEQLAHHVSYHPVDHTSGVAVFARQLKRTSCPHGYLAGQWIFDANTRTQGHFNGSWLSRDHNVEGRLSGRFWTDANGHRQFHGEVSGVQTDQVILEMEGLWCLTPHLGNALCPTCNRIGYFVGRWKYLDGSGGGKLAGNFGEPNLTADTPEVPFRGLWLQHCDQVVGDQSWSPRGD